MRVNHAYRLSKTFMWELEVIFRPPSIFLYTLPLSGYEIEVPGLRVTAIFPIKLLFC